MSLGRPMQGMGFRRRCLRTPGRFHVGRRNASFVRIQPRPGRNKGQRLPTSGLLDGRNVRAAGQQKILVQIGMPEIDAVEFTVEFGQIPPAEQNSRTPDSRTACRAVRTGYTLPA